MTTQTQLRSNVEAERLADCLETHHRLASPNEEAAAELRRLVSFNQQLMDEVARLNQAVADAIAKEREACAKVCEELRFSALGPSTEAKFQRDLCAKAIRARGNVT